MTDTGLRSGRRLLGRLGGVAGSLVLGQLLLGLTYVLAARSMSPASLGLIATTFAIGTLASTVFDMGLTSYLVREVAGAKLAVAQARALLRVKRRVVPLLLVPTMAAGLLIMPRRRRPSCSAPSAGRSGRRRAPTRCSARWSGSSRRRRPSSPGGSSGC